MTTHRSVQTPWGVSKYQVVHAPGIIYYGTESHGGFHLSRARVAAMPDCLKNDKFGDYGPAWYEEDCDWAMVAVVFPDSFLPDDLNVAHSILKNMKPAAYAQVAA